MNELMKELGWSDEPNQKTAEAFLKNLIKAERQNIKPTALKPVVKSEESKRPEQLSFFDQLKEG